jgi:hypothetical protein
MDSQQRIEERNMNCIDLGSGTVDYETVRQAMANEPFTMSLTDSDEIKAVIAAVNEGIDARLEACFCPDRGDRYEGGRRRAGKLTLCRTLECIVSVESMPTLLRRLCESDLGDPEVEAEGNRLASDILMVLGIDEYGTLVGKEALV